MTRYPLLRNGVAVTASGTLFLLCTLTIPAAIAAEGAASAEPPGGALRQSSFGVLTDYFYWTEEGILSRGTVSLREFEWTRQYPWIGDFEYEALLQTKENLRVEKGTRERYRFEYVPRYTLKMKAAHAARLRKLPWVMPTPSADENMVLGKSHGWPEDKEIPGWPYQDYGDPAVPPQDILGYMITDPEVEGPKIKVVLVDGNHASEMHGSWALHAMVDFIASEDPRAATLRRKAVFFVYPMVDPDSRYHQSRIRTMPAQSRYPIRGNPQMYAAWAAEPDRWRPVAGAPDHNRIWNTQGAFTTIDVVVPAMRKDTGGRADYLWDFHGGCAQPGDYRASAEVMQSPYAKAIEAREPDVIRRKVDGHTDGGRLRNWAADEEGLGVTFAFVTETGMPWTKQRVFEISQSFVLAWLDVLGGESHEN
ncbi:MAG: M14 family zinc carboxypeptidase [Thermoguttaceae bacterium]|jgi:hypothetical protein|nr:M14 family zinc carboxypeptidase [Thermoguttaceae bacterium]